MTKKKISLILTAVLLLFAFTLNAQQKFKVVLDAGHGGKDPGNSGNGYSEKNISLKIVLAVGELLEKDNAIAVLYTRKKDVFIELHERGGVAQKSKADLFISVHCDAFHKSSVHGAGTFVLGERGNDGNFRIAQKENSVIFLEDNYKEKYKGFDPNSPESTIGIAMIQEEYLDQSLSLASLIQSNFVKKLKRSDRSVKQDNFQVLRETFMPSILVETGFLTNKNEGAYLNSKKGQREIAKAIYDAIKSFKSQLDANIVVDEKPKEVKPETRIIKGVVFKVQIASSSKKIKPASYNFKGLKNVGRVKVGSRYKYYYGKTSDYIKVQKLKKQAAKKGYNSSFIVAFKRGKKISVKRALR